MIKFAILISLFGVIHLKSSFAHSRELDYISFDSSIPHGNVIDLDVLNPTVAYYSYGLKIVKLGNVTKFEFDDYNNFGREVRVIFGEQIVSLLPFARNIKVTVTENTTTYTIEIEYTLHGSKIYRKYNENTGFIYGNRTFYPVKDYASTEESYLGSASRSLTYSSSTSQHSSERRDTRLDRSDESDSCSRTMGPVIDLTSDFTGVTFVKFNKDEQYESFDGKFIIIDNIDGAWSRLSYKNSKLDLSKSATEFQIFYSSTNDPDITKIIVASKIDAFWTEQYYTFSSKTSELEPLCDFSFFDKLDILTCRHSTLIEDEGKNEEGIKLDFLNFNDHSSFDIVEANGCTTFLHKEGDNRKKVTSIIFPNTTYDIPEGQSYVMLSNCKIGYSTRVSLIVKKDGVFENTLWLTINNETYTVWKTATDDSRAEVLNKIVELFDGSTNPELLPLYQFLPKTSPDSCDDIESLKSFDLLSSTKTYTIISFKGQQKGLILLGSTILELLEPCTIYLDHAPKQAISLHVKGRDHIISLEETSIQSNTFSVVHDSLGQLDKSAIKNDLNILEHRDIPGITWVKKRDESIWNVFPHNYPYSPIGNITFFNTRILSHPSEGYKFVTVKDITDPYTITVFTLLEGKKVAIKVNKSSSGTIILLLDTTE